MAVQKNMLEVQSGARALSQSGSSGNQPLTRVVCPAALKIAINIDARGLADRCTP